MPIGVSRVFHCNVNCSNLERSLTFYRELLGLTQGAHTVPEAPQPGGAFGLDEAQWDAWILSDERGFDGVALDLLEWQVPRPTGSPYPVANHLGFARFGFVTRDLDAAYHRLVAAGVDCYGPPHDVDVVGADGMRAFVCADPDGTPVELVSGDGERFAFLAVNCSSLQRSTEFYSDVLGFNPLAKFSPGPRDESALRLGPNAEWEMAYLDDPRHDLSFAIDLVEWKQPRSEGAPYAAANNLGIYRMALFTDDIDRDYDALQSRGVQCVSAPATLEMGPGIPTLRALLFPDPDGAMLELIESPT
jgi:catechol 2,3-dioxygenase-like lactoylglutathione lyase family enzyme